MTRWKKIKWRDLTPAQLRSLAGDLFDSAHDEEIDRESVEDTEGFDAVGGKQAIGRFLQREAARREKKADGR